VDQKKPWVTGGNLHHEKPRLWQRAVVFFAPNKTYKRLGWNGPAEESNKFPLEERIFPILPLMSPKHWRFLE